MSTKSERDRATLLVMMVDIAKAVQNSRQFTPDSVDIPKELLDIVRNNPEWCSVVNSGWTVEDIFNAFYRGQDFKKMKNTFLLNE
jgi:hypothetical protein